MIRRFSILFAFAALLVVLVLSEEAGSASIYRVIAIERLTSGAAGAYPNLGLLARLDDGAGEAAPYATGDVTWALDRRQLAPDAVDALLKAPAGTQFGWAASGPTGGTAVQLALHKLGVSGDPGEPVIDAAFDIPSEYASIVGSTAPVTIRVGPRQLFIDVNVQQTVGRFRASGVGDVVVDTVGVYFFGTYSAAGATHHFALNPAAATNLELGVAARPCADAACATLGAPVTDAISLALPNTVAVHAPKKAIYGEKATFSGTASSGDRIHLAYLRAAGADPACTPTSVGRLPACSPPFAPTYDRLVETTTADADGRWSVQVVLRTVFVNGPLGLAHPATGSYAAVAYRGDVVGIPSFNGGRFSIFAAPKAETIVSLARPRVTARRAGSRMRLVVSLPGGDMFVHVEVTAGKTTLASGQLDLHGLYHASVPRAEKRLKVMASVSGARSSTTTVALGRND